MAVQEFECQIARNQIGRYLVGEGLSSETLRQLGSHVAECGGCKDYLDLRKNALQSQLTEQEPVKPVVEAATGGSKASETLISKLREQAQAHRLHITGLETQAAEQSPVDTIQEAAQAVVDEPQTKPRFNITFKQSKPFVLCGCLVGVLYFMNGMVHGPNSLLGPKASSVVSDAPVSVTAATSKPTLSNTTVATTVTPPTTNPTPPATASLASKDAKNFGTPKQAVWTDSSTGDKPSTPSSESLIASALPKQDTKFEPKSTVRAQTFAPFSSSAAQKSSGSTDGSSSAPKFSLNSARKQAAEKALNSKRKQLNLSKKLSHRHWHRQPGTGTVHVYDLGK